MPLDPILLPAANPIGQGFAPAGQHIAGNSAASGRMPIASDLRVGADLDALQSESELQASTTPSGTKTR